jgi:hypothetical protein
METPETTREISTRHDDEVISVAVLSPQITGLKELMLEKLCSQDTTLGIIKEQTTKTNGHVADAFIQIATLKDWKNRIVGGLAVSNIVIVPLLMWLIVQHLHT